MLTHFFCLFFLNNWATMHQSQPYIFGVLFKSCLNCKLHSICILGVSCCCQTCLMLSSVGLQTLPCFLFQVFTSHDSWSSRPSHNWNPSPSYCNTSSKTRTSAQRQWANACVSLPFCSSPWWINLWELTPSEEVSRMLLKSAFHDLFELNSSPITKTGTMGCCLIRVRRSHFSFQSST